MGAVRNRLYIYEGCSKHGVKIGISSAKKLSGRLAGLHRRCPASTGFAKVWELPNAFRIEQAVINTMSTSGRNIPPGEEWFDVTVSEMEMAVKFFLELYGPRDAPRRYGVKSGHFFEHPTGS